MQKYTESCIYIEQCVQSALQSFKSCIRMRCGQIVQQQFPSFVATFVSNALGQFPFPSPCSYSCEVFFSLQCLSVKFAFGEQHQPAPLSLSAVNPERSSRSLRLLNTEWVSHFSHKINESTRGGNGSGSYRKGQQNCWSWFQVQLAMQQMKCSPALEMVYPELCSCICLGFYGEMQAVLQLFSIGCGFTISLSKIVLPSRLTIPTPLVALLMSLNLVLSHCETETSSIISIPFMALYFGKCFVLVFNELFLPPICNTMLFPELSQWLWNFQTYSVLSQD